MMHGGTSFVGTGKERFGDQLFAGFLVPSVFIFVGLHWTDAMQRDLFVSKTLSAKGPNQLEVGASNVNPSPVKLIYPLKDSYCLLFVKFL